YSDGICGSNDLGSISNCYNTGDVSASSSSSSNSYSYSDGICGSNDLGSISNCYNTGDVSASSSSSSNSDAYSNAGGICRSNVVGGSISNCYNTGDVSASSSSSDSYNSSYAGGICGDNSTEGSINNCYWNSDSAQTVNGLPQSPKNGVGRGTDTTTPLTTSQMKVQSSFVGFDFSSVWGISTSINNGYPYLWYPVVSVTPSGGSVAISGNVVITFSEAMNTTSGTISLNSTTLTGGIWSSGNTVFTIPYSGLSYNTTYAVNISGFKNVSGNTMTADSSHGFTTVATPTTTTSQFTNNNTFNGSGSRTNFLMPVAIVGGIVLFGLIGVLAFIITRRNSG
ncbi:MAG: Ig-like domain-containing protein, partial [Dehalococcoidia bacterium]|nr:Ig-like domain-containing protein [Dehalococcoidia bacterium]